MWQRDALRRLIMNGRLEENDLNDLLLLCKIAHGITENPEKVPIPLDETHICSEEETGNAVAITAISEVKNVNAIVSPNPLIFKEEGLTIIYGDNGAGKSGYVRILKDVCRARSVDKRILPNIFQSATGSLPSAKIFYKNGTTDGDFDWEKGKPGPQELVCVNVFDASCATLYVDEENKIVYMPLGLDVFDKLAKACDEIKAKLISEKGQLSRTLEILPFSYAETKAGIWFSSIKASTEDEEVNDTASFGEEEKKRLIQLQSILVEDSKTKRAGELRTKKERYQQLNTRIESISAALSTEKIQALKDAKAALDTATEASRLASKTAFEDEPFKVGTSPWRELWNAAKTFSEEEAYPGKDFPYTGPDSKCVLCFQDLGDEAKQRLNRFKAFVQDVTAKNEKKAREAFETERDNLGNLQVLRDTDDTLLKELKGDSAILEASVRKYLKSATNRKETAAKAIQNGNWEEVPVLVENPSEALKKLCASIESAATELEKAENPEVLKTFQDEFDELSAKKWVSERKASIIEEIKRLELIRKYDAATTETNTRSITIMSTELTEKYVTEELKHRFLDKLAAIYGKLNVALDKKEGEKGSTYYYVKLEGSTMPDIETSEIISEGESKAVALAEFLAEISCSPTNSGVIFDDPVSSLDHLIRENVANEFVNLAKDRQVVVFTHDLFFLITLEDIAEKEQVPVFDQQVIREYAGAGACYPEVPLEALKTKDRISRLNRLLDAAETEYKKSAKAYEPHCEQICKEMRKAIERAIEEVLLADIVKRYRRNIYAQNVKRLMKMKKEDCLFLDGMMTEYSKLEHDQEAESRVPLPKPDKLRTDIGKLTDWAAGYHKREITPAAM
jgi:energy-coupling factor transporter ATP-binding protein EcfA2